MRLLLTILSLLISAMLFAQAPALIPYQAIARNAAGEPLANSTLNARFTIHDGTAAGPSVWQELQTVNTGELGLFTVELGTSISLNNVIWSNGAKFMQVELDPGNGFIDMGTQQLLSVPYALHSHSSSGVDFRISLDGDSLIFNNGRVIIIEGISFLNPYSGRQGDSHTCGTPNIHNPFLTYGAMTDQEGNIYKTIVIGTQEWMAENLNTSVYRNGEPISTGLSNTEWANTINTQQGAWSYLKNDQSYYCPFGKLYNWFACADARELCPAGWHVPADSEWTVLSNYLGGEAVAGGKMKTTGTIEAETGLWFAPNAEAINISGFSAVPGAALNFDGEFGDAVAGGSGAWWSSSEGEVYGAFYRTLDYGSDFFWRSEYYKQCGFSVRCLRD